jgi:hypothetical protein
MLRELISRFTASGTPPLVLSHVSQLSQPQRLGILLAKPARVAKVATVAVAKAENRKIEGDGHPGDESTGASVPNAETGLDWLPGPPDEADSAFNGWWAAFDLRDLCRRNHMRVVHAGARVLVVYPPCLDVGLLEYAEPLLESARCYLCANRDKLPALSQADAVTSILAIMRQHPGLKFCRGDDGSMWPLYPKTWTAGQKATLQAFWFAAGDALDRDDFMGIGSG